MQQSYCVPPTDDIITNKILADEEDGLPFAENTFNLVVSSLRYVTL